LSKTPRTTRILLAAFATPAASHAATKYWIASSTTGNWSDNGRWSTTNNAGPANTTRPTDGDAAAFTFADATARTLTANQSVTGAGLLSILLSNTGTGPLTLNQPADVTLFSASISLAGGATTYSSLGTINAASLAIGTTVVPSGAATFVQAGGTSSVNSLLVGTAAAGVVRHNASNVDATTLTIGAGSSGAYVMTSAASAQLSAGAEVIGSTAGSSGTFIQSTGSHFVSGPFTLGNTAGATGNYSLSSTGLLNSGYASSADSVDLSLGANGGSGSFVQTGGTHNFGFGSFGARTLQVGAAGSTGLYSLSGNALLNVNGTLRVGGFSTGSGTFNQLGGSVSISESLSVGAPGAPTGATYTLSAGTLSAPTINNYATLNLQGGTLGDETTTLTNHGSFTASANGTLAARFVNHGTVALPPTFTAHNGYVTHVPLTLSATQRVNSNATPLVNESTLTLNGGSLGGTGGFTNNNLAQGTGTIAGTGPFTNNGQLSLVNGPLTLSTPADSSNFGNIDLSTGNPLRLTAGPLHNYGYLALNSSSVSGTATLYNPGGTIAGRGSILTPFVNAGSLLPAGGAINIPSGFANEATVRLIGPGVSLAGGPILNTGTITGDGAVTNPITNAGRIEPAGFLTLASPLTNTPTGTLALPAHSTLSLSSPLANNTSAGLISLSGGSLLLVNQPLTNTGQISGHGTLHAASLTNDGTIVLANGTSTLHGPVTNNPTARIELRFSPTLFTGPVTNHGTLTLHNANVTFANNGSNLPLAAPAALSALLPSSFSSAGLSGTGSLTLSPASTLSTSFLHQSTLTNAGTLTLRPRQQGGRPSFLATLTLLPNSTLDLADNPLTLTKAPHEQAAFLPTLRHHLAQGLLTSTTPDPAHTTSLAYLPTPAGILIRLTSTGDANLDGLLDADDYALLDQGLLTGGAFWHQGDFDYDGQVTSADYLLLDTTLAKQQGTPPSPALLATRESRFGPAYVSHLLTALPEPSPLTLLAPLAPLAFTRRGNRRRR
jgi:hypothetical protein